MGLRDFVKKHPGVGFGPLGLLGEVVIKTVKGEDTNIIGDAMTEINQTMNEFGFYGIHICVLGPRKAGKTTFLNWLRNGVYSPTYRPTNREPYEMFPYKEKTIGKGEDIGGSNEFKSEYIDKIEKCDVCIFVFDANQFINDKSYRQEIWDTADLIYRNAQALGKTVCTIGTHLDFTDYPNGDRLREKIYKLSEQKPFKDMFHTNCMVADLTNQQYFAACAKLIFGV